MWIAEPIHSVHGQVFSKRRDKWQRKKRQQYRGSPQSRPKLNFIATVIPVAPIINAQAAV